MSVLNPYHSNIKNKITDNKSSSNISAKSLMVYTEELVQYLLWIVHLWSASAHIVFGNNKNG